MIRPSLIGLKQIAGSTALVAGATLAAHVAGELVGLSNLALLYLLPVMLAAGRWGFGAGLYAAVIATLAFNFFLVPPRYTLDIADSGDLVTMLLLFAVALALSHLSAQIRAQAALAERLAGDRQREAFREALLSSISHDLRTPITAIRSGLEALGRDGGDHEALASAQAETLRLDHMVTNLLDMTRIDAGATAPRADVIDLTDSISAAIDALSAARRGSIAINVTPALPLVRADPAMLHHMLVNLLDNAWRHGGGREVTIEAGQDAAGIQLRIADRGPGLAPGQAAHIFDRFRRGDPGRPGQADGTGLGLAIVRGFGNAMGLTTTVDERSDGPGLIFTIGFPAPLLVATERLSAP